MTKPKLGVCYYPEHWPEETWAEDAQRMVNLGLTVVRIGEFAWSRMEPTDGDVQLDWLARAIDTLGAAGLEVVLGTPTATPPKWLFDQIPDMAPVGVDGSAGGFGSRRHYCFSHPGYRDACKKIVTQMAARFGTHSAVTAWQIDNEYGCHLTARSYSKAALGAFRLWLNQKYQSVDRLNREWGNAFWSMEYASFDEIELPNQTVTVANPSHTLDFYRFSSEQIVFFNRLQADIIRAHSPGRDIIHNFMGRTLDFDHFDVGSDLDVSSWDSYPLGFLGDRIDADPDHKRKHLRTGDPDFQAFHHDLYRATSSGRWWVMEQQPGPVNWANHNPAPAPGMVRMWTWEAIAHGAEVVSYFRWRQAPFAQEQYHAGLLRPDSIAAPGFAEAKQVAKELAELNLDFTADTPVADVAIVFDYPSSWAWEILPQGAEFDYFNLVFDFYRAARRLGLSVDFVSSKTQTNFTQKLILVPGLFSWPNGLRDLIRQFHGPVLIGPRTGSKTENYYIPVDLPPDTPSIFPGLKITHLESLPNGAEIECDDGGHIKFWREFVEHDPALQSVLEQADGQPVLMQQNNHTYLAAWPDDVLADRILRQLASDADIKTTPLADGLRTRQLGEHLFLFNYGDTTIDVEGLGIVGTQIFGPNVLQTSDVAIIKRVVA